MRIFASILTIFLASLPIFGQVTITGMTLEDVTITAAAVSTPAPDWSSSFGAVWDFENAGSPGISTGGDSNACDLSSFEGSRETGAGDYVHNTASALFEDSSGQGETGNTSCDEVAADLDGTSVTWGAWYYAVGDGTDNDIPNILATDGNGYYLTVSTTSGDLRCAYYQDTSLSYATADSTGDEMPDDEWHHPVCVWDDGSDTLTVFADGAQVGQTGSLTESMDSSAATGVQLAANLHSLDKYIDEAWVYAGVLSGAEIARVAACGVDGADCTCNGTAYVTYGKTDESCVVGNEWACCTGAGTGCVDQDLLTDDCNKVSP